MVIFPPGGRDETERKGKRSTSSRTWTTFGEIFWRIWKDWVEAGDLWLYGKPQQTPLSDLDLALLFQKGRVPDFKRQLEIYGRIPEILHEDDVSITPESLAGPVPDCRFFRRAARSSAATP